MNTSSNRIALLRVSFIRFAYVGIAILLMGSPATAKTIKDVQKELIEKSSKLKSYSAKMTTKSEYDIGQGNKSKTESTGTMEWASKETPKGDKFLYRMESKDINITVVSGEESKTVSKTLTVCDGDFIYTLSDSDGQKMAVKMKVQSTQSYDIKATFDAWEKTYNLKLLADEKFDNADCWVIEATPKKKAGEQVGASPIFKSKFWYRKDVGLMVKTVSFDKNNKPTSTTTITDIKANIEIKPERFKFKCPEGVQLMDMTQQQQSVSQETSTGAAPEQESQSSKHEPEKKDVKEDKKEEEKDEDKPVKKGLKGLKKLFGN